ncbi:MAG: phospholipase [Saprospiraceae bacterium]|nr:phospholipase [Lewinella sp.]
MYLQSKNLHSRGLPLPEASKAMVMFHGQGGSSSGILDLADHLQVDAFALLAPEATAKSWYPNSFMAPIESNQADLDTGFALIRNLIAEIEQAGIAREAVYFLGFSQGACLLAEYLARHADLYGGAFLFSGGLIGKRIDRRNYQGDFKNMPLLIGCSNIDAHVPLHRVQDSSRVFTEMGAQVTERIYLDGPHSVIADEIELANKILRGE